MVNPLTRTEEWMGFVFRKKKKKKKKIPRLSLLNHAVPRVGHWMALFHCLGKKLIPSRARETEEATTETERWAH